MSHICLYISDSDGNFLTCAICNCISKSPKFFYSKLSTLQEYNGDKPKVSFHLKPKDVEVKSFKLLLNCCLMLYTISITDGITSHGDISNEVFEVVNLSNRG